jgi:alpha-tubulin suppressor-like RCC1 family protein
MYNIEYTIEGKMSIFIGRREVDNISIWGKSNTDVSLNTTGITGNVGIGLSNPTYKLDVSGNARIRGLLQVNSIPSNPTQDTLDWSSNTTERATLKNVGIGITNPSRALEVNGNVIVSSSLTNTGVTSSTGCPTVPTVNEMKNIDHYGNMSVTTMNTLNGLYAPCVSIGMTDTNMYHTNVEISGDVYVSDILMDYDDPYDFRVNGLVSTDHTGFNASSYVFYYISKSGYLNANSPEITSSSVAIGATTGSAVERRTYYFPTGYETEVVDKVYANSYRTMVLTRSGKVFSMGNNENASLGIDSDISVSQSSLIRSFTRVFHDASVIDISASGVQFKKILLPATDGGSSYALTTTGNLYAAGRNGFGQLIDGTTTATNTKTPVCPNIVEFATLGAILNFVKDAVVMGSNTAGSFPTTICVLDNSSGVWCAGYGANGQCGQGNTSNINLLNTVKTSGVALTGILAIYGFGFDANTGFMALSTTGKLYVWGKNSTDTLLNGTSTDLSSAIMINSLIGGGKDVSNAWLSSDENGPFIIQATDGLVYGTGRYFGLGTGLTSGTGWRQLTHFNTTTKVLQYVYTVRGTDDGSTQSNFAVSRNSTTGRYTLWATGGNTYGQLGIGNTTYQNTWVNVGIHSDIVQMISNIVGTDDPRYACILLNNGRVLKAGQDIPLYNSTGTSTTRFTYLS